jgi:hypothetical protein
MRKKLFIILIALGIFSACDNQEELNTRSSDDVVNITPIEPEEGYAEISAFFDSELPFDTYSKGFFVGSNEHSGDEVCKIINSKKELEDLYSGDKDIPEIDFQHYSLIIGQRIMPDLGNRCIKQELVYTTIDKISILNLYVENLYEYKPCMIAPLYFWGLYPKLNLLNIKINIIMSQRGQEPV